MFCKKWRELKDIRDDDTGTIDKFTLISICGLTGTAAQSRLTTRDAHSLTAAQNAKDAWLRRASEGMSMLSMTMKSTPRISIKTVIVGVCGAEPAVAGAGAMGAIIKTVLEEVWSAGEVAATAGAGAVGGAAVGMTVTEEVWSAVAGTAMAGAGAV